MTKGWTVIWLLLLVFAIYLNAFKLHQYDGQGEQRREYRRMHNK